MRMHLLGLIKFTSLAIGAGFLIYPATDSLALVEDPDTPFPPTGWKNVCSGGSIKVTPRPSDRIYTGNGTCWINTAKDKTHASNQSWTQVAVTLNGTYTGATRRFTERLTFNTPAGARAINLSGECSDDPWATNAGCAPTADPNPQLGTNFGWYLGYSGSQVTVPLSRNVFGADLIQGMLSNQESKPPLAPVGLDATRWPGPKGDSGDITWRAADMSDNKWVLQFDIEYANFPDATFTKAGQRVGPGPKKNLSASEANMSYVFTPSFQLQGQNYYFRVCALNDSGRQCSAAVLAHPPTKQQQMGRVGRVSLAAGSLLAPGGGGTPPASGAPKSSGPVALGTARPGISTGGAPAGGGSTGIALAGKSAPTALGAARPGGAAGGGATPGAVAIPDLAVGRGMIVRDQTIAWGNATNLTLRADAARECELPVSFQYENVGKGPAGNVTAEISDSLHPAQPIASQTLASMTAGQSSTVRGVLKVGAQVQPRQVVVVAKVHESGQIHETNMTNDRGSITLNVTCRQ